MHLIWILVLFVFFNSIWFQGGFAQEQEIELDEEFTDEVNCEQGTVLANGVCTVIDNGCEPDIYGNIYCDPLVEDRLTLERFLFEPPIINDKPTIPMGIVILIISGIIVGIFLIMRKRK